MWKFIKNNTLLAVGIILLIFSLIVYLISLIPSFKLDETPKSEDSVVNNAIDVIDDALGAYGTLNRHHKPIFEVLKRLSKEQLIRLHKDFGLRAYSPLLKGYKVLSLFGWFGYSERKGLNAIYLNELEPFQLDELRSIYTSKGLDFPYLK